MKDDRPELAMRLRTLRLAKGFTNQKHAAARVRAETGVRGLSDSVWGDYESGRRDEHGKLIRPMSAKHRDAIETVLGPLEPQRPAEPSGAGDIASLVRIVEAQQDQIDTLRGMVTDLVPLIRDERIRPPWWAQDVAKQNERIIAALDAVAPDTTT